MPRTITIHLTDGRQLTRDYHDFAQGMQVPLGAKLNHPLVINIAKAIANNGTIDTDNTTEKEVRWLSPSQIKHVAISETEKL